MSWFESIRRGRTRDGESSVRSPRPDLARVTLAVWLPLVIGGALVWGVYAEIANRLEQEHDTADSLTTVDQVAHRLAVSVHELSGTAAVLARGAQVRATLSGDDEAANACGRRFLVELEERQDSMQIRLLDRSAREHVRVERGPGGPVPTPRAQLQNKSDRYYVQAAMALAVGEVYISRLDLNVEHGRVETPWRPTLRVAGLVTTPDLLTAGTLVVNVDARPLLATFEPKPGREGAMMLYDGDGFALAGARPEDLWGFMFDRPTSLATSRPELWRRISEMKRGVFRDGDVLYAVSTVEPARFRSLGPTDARPIASFDHWKIVSRRPVQTLVTRWNAHDYPLAALLFVLSCLVSWIWGRAIVDRREALRSAARAEADVVRSRRMAALGRMVAGVAHELNTPIGNAMMVASSMAQSVGEFEREIRSGPVRRAAFDEFTSDLKRGSEILMRGLTRSADLVSRFKQVAVDQTGDLRRSFSLDELTQHITDLAAPRVRKDGHTLDLELHSHATLDSFPGPLGQVMMNLIDNSRLHGFREGATGKIVVSTRADGPDHVELTVLDNGAGIGDTHADRIFEPFYTTRLGSGGTGLGLSIVHQIITKQLGGSIAVSSAPGRTEFQVRLPIAAPEAASGREDHHAIHP